MLLVMFYEPISLNRNMVLEENIFQKVETFEKRIKTALIIASVMSIILNLVRLTRLYGTFLFFSFLLRKLASCYKH